jgi:dCMP deaminase
MEKMLTFKWENRFLEIAKLVASWSKDPSTQTGAVITDKDHRIISIGYNGFAKGVKDWSDRYDDRDTKYKMIVHCERNAIIFAQRSLKDCILYTWPFASCAPCAAMVIQTGIKKCVAPKLPDELKERWQEDLDISAIMYKEAEIELVIL